MAVLRNIRTIYKANSAENQRDYPLCEQFAKNSASLMRALPIIYFGVITVAACFVIPEYVLTGELKPTHHLYFPSADGQIAVSADLVLIVTNFGLLSVLTVILYAFDSLVLLTFINVPLISQIIVRSLEELQSNLNNNAIGKIQIKRKIVENILLKKKYKK